MLVLQFRDVIEYVTNYNSFLWGGVLCVIKLIGHGCMVWKGIFVSVSTRLQ